MEGQNATTFPLVLSKTAMLLNAQVILRYRCSRCKGYVLVPPFILSFFGDRTLYSPVYALKCCTSQMLAVRFGRPLAAKTTPVHIAEPPLRDTRPIQFHKRNTKPLSPPLPMLNILEFAMASVKMMAFMCVCVSKQCQASVPSFRLRPPYPFRPDLPTTQCVVLGQAFGR